MSSLSCLLLFGLVVALVSPTSQCPQTISRCQTMKPCQSRNECSSGQSCCSSPCGLRCVGTGIVDFFKSIFPCLGGGCGCSGGGRCGQSSGGYGQGYGGGYGQGYGGGFGQGYGRGSWWKK